MAQVLGLVEPPTPRGGPLWGLSPKVGNVADMNLCRYCNTSTPLSGEEQLEHLANLFKDMGILQAMVLIHGSTEGPRRYIELGQIVHLTRAELNE